MGQLPGTGKDEDPAPVRLPTWSMGCSGTGEHLAVGPEGVQRVGAAGAGTPLPHPLLERAGWAAPCAWVNGPIGFFCWSV